MLGGYVAYSCVAGLGLPYPVAVLVAVAATAALGWVFELFLLERLIDDHLGTLMLTLGLYLVTSTVLLTVFGPLSMEFRFPVSGSMRFGPIYVPKENMVVLAVCLAAIGGLWLVLFSTDLGQRCGRWLMIGRSRWRKECGRSCYSLPPLRLPRAWRA